MQPDLFEETLEKKILRMEKWMHRLHKELLFLKEVYNMSQSRRPSDPPRPKAVQIDMFGT